MDSSVCKPMIVNQNTLQILKFYELKTYFGVLGFWGFGVLGFKFNVPHLKLRGKRCKFNVPHLKIIIINTSKSSVKPLKNNKKSQKYENAKT